MRPIWLCMTVLVTAPAPLSGQAVDPRLEEAVRWYTGVAGRVDNARAKALLLEAAADRDPISRMWIARVYSRGRMDFERNEERARTIAREVIDRIEALAAARVPEAVFLMGTAYHEGLGKTESVETAVAWYRRAADFGHGLAQHNLGNIYFEGRGVAQNDSHAVHWWTLAAEEGDAIPQLRLGIMYEEGRGVERDLETARRWYERAAARGNAEAHAALQRLGRRVSDMNPRPLWLGRTVVHR
ncbi:MAG: tetratricopeptide repeat protein [Gemmatimonadales bacterium]